MFSFILVIAMFILTALEIELSRAVDKARHGTYHWRDLLNWKTRVRGIWLGVLLGLILSVFFL